MKESHLIQHPENGSSPTVLKMVQRYCSRHQLDRIFISMAYVSVSGVRSLLECFPKAVPSDSKWLVGLDDCISQPGAIDHLLTLQNAEVRIASLDEYNVRFHPKVMYLKSSQNPNIACMAIGSANLTRRGLTSNVEAVVFLETQSPNDVKLLDEVWDQHWCLGKVPDAKALEIYRSNYNNAKAARKGFRSGVKATTKRPRTGKTHLILETDEAELDPSRAETCWIECGYITAMGRELEIKAEQGLFFGLNPTGGKVRRLHFNVSDGNTVNLKMKYQGNHMWRLQMTNEVPEVRQGLRPKNEDGSLGRSDKVAVITKTKTLDTFGLSFVNLRSREFEGLLNQTAQNGTLGKTSARSYGWL
jgi:HKD family nuclease